VAASSVFSIPFWRHFIAWLGGVPATPGNFKKVLKKGSVAVIVGGIAEMYMQVSSVVNSCWFCCGNA
jgi:2-acylglycerol O-acyltransferase 2